MPLKHLYIGLAALLLAACATPAPTTYGSVSHVILIWFKDSVTAEEISAIKERTLELQSIPGIRSIRMGGALPSQRPVVDDSFDLGIVMDFDSTAAMGAYLEHPRHQAFVKRYVKGRVERLLIYDIRSEMR